MAEPEITQKQLVSTFIQLNQIALQLRDLSKQLYDIARYLQDKLLEKPLEPVNIKQPEPRGMETLLEEFHRCQERMDTKEMDEWLKQHQRIFSTNHGTGIEYWNNQPTSQSTADTKNDA